MLVIYRRRAHQRLRQHPCSITAIRWPRLAWRLHEIAGVVPRSGTAVERTARGSTPLEASQKSKKDSKHGSVHADARHASAELHVVFTSRDVGIIRQLTRRDTGDSRLACRRNTLAPVNSRLAGRRKWSHSPSSWNGNWSYCLRDIAEACSMAMRSSTTHARK